MIMEIDAVGNFSNRKKFLEIENETKSQLNICISFITTKMSSKPV